MILESFFIFGFGFVLQEKLYADDYTNIVANAVRVLMIIVCVTSFDWSSTSCMYIVTVDDIVRQNQEKEKNVPILKSSFSSRVKKIMR